LTGFKNDLIIIQKWLTFLFRHPVAYLFECGAQADDICLSCNI